MRFDGNGGSSVNYQPNSFGGPVDDKQFSEPPLAINGAADRFDHRLNNDDYGQAGNLYRLMSDDQKAQLADNLTRALLPVPKPIQLRQLKHFYQADPDYGISVAKGLGISTNEITEK